MFFPFSGESNNEDLVANLVQNKRIQSPAVQQVMLSCDRGDYAPSDPYEDRPQAIGFDATISAPHMHAIALQALVGHLTPGASVLDVGCGSGYLSACMAAFVGESGSIFAIDYLKGLTDLTTTNISKSSASLLESGRVKVIIADGWAGLPAEAPFDCIHVGAAADSIPTALVQQLRPGGRMIIPVGPRGSQQLLQVDVDQSRKVTQTALMGVRYVPLVHVAF
jgi:protein-L-isoaspartate(D-aspartate) O-methyltransferase